VRGRVNFEQHQSPYDSTRKSWFVMVEQDDLPDEYLGPDPAKHSVGYQSVNTAINVAMQWITGRGYNIGDFAIQLEKEDA
jgi:hypothetical protein